MKGIITMLLILAIIPAAFSEIVPNYIEFRGNPGTVICEDIVIMHSGELHGEDMWGTSGPKKNPNLYKDSHDVYGLAVDYPEDLTVEGYKNISICVSANKSIEVYGVLIYKEPAEIGSSLSMGYGYGVWLSAKIGIVQEVTTTTIQIGRAHV